MQDIQLCGIVKLSSSLVIRSLSYVVYGSQSSRSVQSMARLFRRTSP